MEAICEGQWNKYLSDEPDFMSQLMLGNFSIPVHHHDNNNCSNLALPSAFWPSLVHHDSNTSSDVTSMHYSSHFFPTPSHHNFTVDGNIQVDEFLSQDVSNHSFQGMREKKIGESPEEERSKKRPPRIDIPPDVQRSKKLKSDVERNKTNININGASYCSEDYPNEISGVASTSSSKKSEPLHLTRKTRASKGTATDPQSLYARKRRERINERLRVLQNLVPNGTKVDISTMLEEAVQYVKFLQLQIKLLSSDDMWMYAPIAYNGMNLGLDLIISTPRSQS